MKKAMVLAVVFAVAVISAAPAAAQNYVCPGNDPTAYCGPNETTPDDEPPGMEYAVELTGTLERLDGAAYGTHAVTDEQTGTFYALSASRANLDAFVGQRVQIYGGVVPETADAQMPHVLVTEVFPLEFDPPRAVSETGVIHDNGAGTIYGYGTHAIANGETGAFYRLQSDTINLDEYVGQNVTVYGTAILDPDYPWPSGGPPLITVTDVTTAPQGAATEQYGQQATPNSSEPQTQATPPQTDATNAAATPESAATGAGVRVLSETPSGSDLSPSGSSEEPRASGVASASYTALPDTGGASPIALGAGILLVAGGVMAVRKR